MTEPLHITSEEEFQQAIAYQWLTIIDFYADRCWPCKILAPIMHQLATENEEKEVKILKVNIDELPNLATQFDVTTIPTVFFIKAGEVQEGIIGVHPKSLYEEKIASYL